MIDSPLIDWKLALKRANQNEDLAKTLFSLFMQDLPEQISALKACQQSADVLALRNLLHKIQGGCCYLGVPTLEQQVKALSECLKQEDPRWPLLLKETIELMEGFLSNEDAQNLIQAS